MALQNQLARDIVIPPSGQGYRPKPGDLILALDAQYAEGQAFVGLDACVWPGRQLGGYAATTQVQAPYIPRLFCFREGPPLVAAVVALRERLNLVPDLILVDGHGIAHPRRFGVACWVGLETARPTIGCAKSALLNYMGEIGKKRGAILPIEDRNEFVGAAVTTRDNVKPVFVSPGHKINLDTAVEIILALSRYRVPDPLRRADQVARAWARGQVLDGVTALGGLD